MNTYQRELTDKQRKFCDLYLSGMNATRAALQAGYSRGTAMNGQLMTLPLVRKYLDEHQSANSAGDVKVSADRLLAELCKVAFANVANCFNTDGSLKRIDDIDPDTMAGIESISFSATGAVKIKMFNKMQAIEKIAKRTGFYKQAEKADEPAVVTALTNVVTEAKKVTEPTIVTTEATVITGHHPDFVDDSFDVAPAIAEMEDYMNGKTGDDPTEDEINAKALALEFKSGEAKAGSCCDVTDAEREKADAWISKAFARQLEAIRAERKLVAV